MFDFRLLGSGYGVAALKARHSETWLGPEVSAARSFRRCQISGNPLVGQERTESPCSRLTPNEPKYSRVAP